MSIRSHLYLPLRDDSGAVRGSSSWKEILFCPHRHHYSSCSVDRVYGIFDSFTRVCGKRKDYPGQHSPILGETSPPDLSIFKAGAKSFHRSCRTTHLLVQPGLPYINKSHSNSN